MWMMMLGQVIASQPIVIRDPGPPRRLETQVSAECGRETIQLRWTVLEHRNSRFDAVLRNGRRLPRSEIQNLNRWLGGRVIEGVAAICQPAPRARTRLLVEFGGAERLNLPKFESFEVVGNRLVFEPRRASSR